MPRATIVQHDREDTSRPAKRIKLTHRRDRSSSSILENVSSISTTLAGFASRIFFPGGPSNEQFDSKPVAPLVIRTPPEPAPWSSSISLLSVMAEEHASLWEQLEHAQDGPCDLEPAWMGIQSRSRDYSVRIGRGAHQPHSFLDMDDSDSDSGDSTTDPTTGHSAFSDWDSDSDTDESELTSSPSTSSTSPPPPASLCAATTGHSFWDDTPQSGDEYWDRQIAMLCAKHIRDAFPGAASRGTLPLEQFIVDVLRATRGSVRDDVAFVALQFIKRLAPVCPLGYYEDMFFTSLILADKVENDDGHSLRWWSAQCDGQWSISELKTMEWRMLETLDWNLSTSLNCSSSYQSFLAELSSFVFV